MNRSSFKLEQKAIYDNSTFHCCRYHEKIRPGPAQILCASFSQGGIFYVAGSADHHIRIYQMNHPDGPTRVLEEEAHDERVDSVTWCNQPDLR